jgi:two-component system, NarL family, sensor histidine kinase UhpB
MFKVSFLLYLFVVPLHLLVTAQNKQVDSLIGLLRKAAPDTVKVNHYRNISGILKFTDPAQAIVYGQQGVMLAKKLGFDNGTAGCYLNISTAYIYSDVLDSALLYLDTALIYARKAGDDNRLGLAYLNRADIYRQQQNFTQSLKDCDTALSYADKANNDDVRARVNQTIGSIYYQQETYIQSIPFFDKALALYRKTNNMRMTAAMHNNLGLIYKSIKDFQKALVFAGDAIRITDSLKDETNLSIFNGNLCDIYIDMGNYKEAEKYADKAFNYAVKQHNEKLMAIARHFQGDIYAKQKRITEAIAVLEKALPVFQKLDATDRIYTTGDLLAEVYALQGNHKKAYEYMRISKVANDSLVKWRYDDGIIAMQTKFQVKNKDNEIQLLGKDKELQQQKLQRQRLLMLGAGIILLFAFGGIWLFINRNKLKQRMKELELRNQIAADLHDEVGSSLSSIHMLSQMASSGNAAHQDILARMSSNAKETMDKMGDIVWMIKPGETEAGSLQQRMERFAYEIGSSKNIEVTLELDSLEKVKLSMEQRKNIYLIFKEAINNAAKYADTEKLEVTITVQHKELILRVKDFGKGFDSHLIKKGNGLDNMQHRAKELHGAIQVSSEAGVGTTILLTIPVTAP